MDLVVILCIVIAILIIALIIETVWLIKLYRGKKKSDWQLSWYDRLGK